MKMKLLMSSEKCCLSSVLQYQIDNHSFILPVKLQGIYSHYCVNVVIIKLYIGQIITLGNFLGFVISKLLSCIPVFPESCKDVSDQKESIVSGKA